jgi:dihydrofolate synthase / folylpolyglutamate synthase
MADFARSDDPAVQAQLDRLARLSPGGDRLGLDRISRLLERLGRPQDKLPPVFHVAGTNGKGSTCAFLRAALEAAGKRVHVFTSPHLVRFNERIRIAGRLIDNVQLAGLLEEVLEASEGIDASFFEVTTAVAFLAFSRTPADACVIEVGLGGRLDATNVIQRPLVAGITSLGLDHQQFLGKRMVDIAAEKAGIAKAGVPLVTQLYPPAIGGRIATAAAAAGAQWLPRGGTWDAIVERKRLRYRDAQGSLALPLPRMPGRYQALNAALAVAMVRHQDRIAVGEAQLCAAVGWTDWPARLQRLADGPLTQGREVWVDGGHNPSAARLVSGWAKLQFGGRPLQLIFASLKSKDARGVLQPFTGLAAHVHTLPIRDHDCRSAEELVSLAQDLGFDATAHESLRPLLGGLPANAPVLIFGSLYLAGEALTLNGQVPD